MKGADLARAGQAAGASAPLTIAVTSRQCRSTARTREQATAKPRVRPAPAQAGLATLVECSRSNKQRDHEVLTAAPDVSDSRASTTRVAASMSQSSQRAIASTIGPVVGLRSHRRLCDRPDRPVFAGRTIASTQTRGIARRATSPLSRRVKRRRAADPPWKTASECRVPNGVPN
jgi:hypothetical protein